jgi:hypothetical protein
LQKRTNFARSYFGARSASDSKSFQLALGRFRCALAFIGSAGRWRRLGVESRSQPFGESLKCLARRNPPTTQPDGVEPNAAAVNGLGSGENPTEDTAEMSRSSPTASGQNLGGVSQRQERFGCDINRHEVNPRAGGAKMHRSQSRVEEYFAEENGGKGNYLFLSFSISANLEMPEGVSQ